MIRNLIFIFVLSTCNQISENLSREKLFSLVRTDREFKVMNSFPSANGKIGMSEKIQINFNQVPNFDACMKAFQIFPNVRGNFTEVTMGIEFSPNNPWEPGTYSLTLLKSCEDREGNDLNSIFNFQFSVIAPATVPEPEPGSPTPPFVQAIGLESQNCSENFPGKGSLVGGDWNLDSCFWDSTLPILPASKYLIRGGDTGMGSFGSTVSCNDILTDNIKIIFSEFMNPASTVQAVRLKKISVPPSNILLSSHTWKDCSQNGCRVLILRFSEMEASCNGNLFGSISTGGDFNLQKTENSIPGSIQYILTIDAASARTTSGSSLISAFYFTMEGK